MSARHLSGAAPRRPPIPGAGSPRAAAACLENLQDFVGRARASRHPALLRDDFDDHRWEIACPRRRGRKGSGALWFTTSSARIGQSPDPLPEPFASFAKAVVTRWVSLRVEMPTISALRDLLYALRYLHAALPAPEACPTSLQALHFASAELAIWDGHTDRGSLNRTRLLNFVVSVVNELGLTPASVEWTACAARATSGEDGPSKEALRRRELLFTAEELAAVATLSLDPGDDHRDRVFQRVVDLLACGALRVGEACSLPFDTLVEHPILDKEGNVVFDASGAPAVQYGLRYWPEKGGRGETLLRPIPTVMGPLAKRAVEDLKALTAPCRRVALAHHQGRSPFDEAHWKDLPGDTLLNPAQVADMLGLANGHVSGKGFIRSWRIPSEPVTHTNLKNRSYVQAWVRKGAIEAFCRERSFVDTCIDGEDRYIPLHECLLIIPFTASGATTGYAGTAVPVIDEMIGAYLSSKGVTPSAFRQRKLAYADGGEVRVTSNMFRYWLDTAAMKGGLNHYDIARWMGRSKVSVNRAYDHRSPEEKAGYLYQAAAATLPSTMSFTAEARLDGGADGAAGHATKAGRCRSLFGTAPCPNFLRSLEEGAFASDLVILDAAHLRELLKATRELLQSAEEAFEAESYGAATWAHVHRTTLSIIQKEVDRRTAAVAGGPLVKGTGTEADAT